MNGEPYAIEYNVRMGDPETQVVMPRVQSDLAELLMATWQGNLDQYTVEIDPRYASTVVLISGGYPRSYKKGHVIKGIPKSTEHTIVFHAGTAENEGSIVTSGGRVLAVTGLDKDIVSALERSYEGVKGITWKDINYRGDIGQDLIKQGKQV